MQITVKYVNPPKEGKTLGTVKIQDDTLLGYDPAKFQPEKGQTYEVEIASRDYNGKTYKNVTKWQKMGEQKAANGSASNAPWFMPFVSNTVAHAIQAGKITGPAEIQAWAEAAKAAAEVLASSESPY